MLVMPKPYPKEFREDVVAVARRGQDTLAQIAKDFGIAESCLRNWLRAADIADGSRPGLSTAESEQLRELKRRNRLLERRRRAERALTTVVATCYLLGVSTRRMEKLVETLEITRLSKSQVSVMAKELDEQVESFRSRPLDAGPYTFVAADALVLKVRAVGGWSTSTRCSRPGSTPTGTGRSSAWTSPPGRTAPAGWRSSAA